MPVPGTSEPLLNHLDENLVLGLLDNLQRKLYRRLVKKTSLVVHGGVVGVLYLKSRPTTADVDYIARRVPDRTTHTNVGRLLKTCISYLAGISRGLNSDTNEVIESCISETADDFNKDPGRPFTLKQNWMNSGPDIILPLDNEYVLSMSNSIHLSLIHRIVVTEVTLSILSSTLLGQHPKKWSFTILTASS